MASASWGQAPRNHTGWARGASVQDAEAGSAPEGGALEPTPAAAPSPGSAGQRDDTTPSVDPAPEFHSPGEAPLPAVAEVETHPEPLYKRTDPVTGVTLMAHPSEFDSLRGFVRGAKRRRRR